MDLAKVIPALYPNAVYKDEMVNFHSLTTIKKTWLSNENGPLPTMTELEGLWAAYQNENPEINENPIEVAWQQFEAAQTVDELKLAIKKLFNR